MDVKIATTFAFRNLKANKILFQYNDRIVQHNDKPLGK